MHAPQDTETDASVAQYPTQFISLWRNPPTSAHALAVGEQISRGAGAPLGTITIPRHGISEIVVGSQKYGEAVEIPWGQVRSSPWLGAAFAQTNLTRTAWLMRQSHLYVPGLSALIPLPISTIGKIALLGPDRRDIADGFTQATSRTRYPAFWGHEAERILSIEGTPNRWLLPRATAAAGWPLRNVAVLWERAGTIMIAERSRLNTQRTMAVRLSRPALSNVWWPLRLRERNENAEKSLALWLNCTLGVLTSIAHRIPTQGAWIQFKKPTIENMPVLDVLALSNAQLRMIADGYDLLAPRHLKTFSEMADDPTRADIDKLFCRVLGLPALDELRSELAREPIITLRPCYEEGMPIIQPDDQLEFELI